MELILYDEYAWSGGLGGIVNWWRSKQWIAGEEGVKRLRIRY